jgi:hypothetical protein
MVTRFPNAVGGLPSCADSSLPVSKLLATGRTANYFTLQSASPLHRKAGGAAG